MQAEEAGATVAMQSGDGGLSFEYSTVEADIHSKIDSVKNPVSGIIRAEAIDEIIFDDRAVDSSKTEIIVGK